MKIRPASSASSMKSPPGASAISFSFCTISSALASSSICSVTYH